MDIVKVKDVRTGAVKEVKKEIAGDFVGTGNFVIVDEKKENKSKNNIFNKPLNEDKEEK